MQVPHLSCFEEAGYKSSVLVYLTRAQHAILITREVWARREGQVPSM
jgi:hypothetical protein